MLQPDSLDLRRLRAFHLVGRHGSLRLAASRLKQSIPAISAKIRKLESELGIELFERLPNKMVLTIAGERFLREVEGIFERAEQALASLNSVAPEGRLSVSVGSDHAWFYAPKIRRFLNRYPNVSLSLRVYKSADALVALDQGDIDIGFGIFPELPKRIERMVVATTTLSIAYNPTEIGQPLRRKPTRLADLGRQRLIVPPDSTTTRRLVEAGGHDLDANATVIEAPTCETAANFVEMGVGVAFVHTLCIERHHSRHIQTIDLGPKSGEVAFCAVYRKRALAMPLVKALLDEVMQPGS